MKNLTANDMLNVWEQGLNQPLLQRALILLVAAFPEMEADTVAKLSIGQRDCYLLQLRQCLFGSKLINTAVCPECAEQIEWDSRVADFLSLANEDDLTVNEFDFSMDDYSLRFRLPNSLDIAAVVNHVNAEQAQQQLLSRCLLKSEHSGTGCAVDQLPDTVIEQLSTQIETLDPLAEIRIDLVCPECSHSWYVLFDIASFLWLEVNDWSEAMLQTVHRLAAAYGWSEADILNLSPVRRQLYLGMLGS